MAVMELPLWRKLKGGTWGVRRTMKERAMLAGGRFPFRPHALPPPDWESHHSRLIICTGRIYLGVDLRDLDFWVSGCDGTYGAVAKLGRI